MTEYITFYDDDNPVMDGPIVQFGIEVKEEVVRCRDCAFAYRVHWPESCDVPPEFLNCHGPLVSLWDYERDEPKPNPVEPDGFCYWGERRSE